MTPPVLVCFAVPQEATPFRKLVRSRPDIRLLITGMGQKNAEGCLRRELAQIRPANVLTCGFAGALDPALRIGDVVYESADLMLAQRLEAAGAVRKTLHCSSRIAGTALEKRQLAESTGACVVEMESAHIQKICQKAGVPCATVRAISDTAAEDLPLDFNALMTEDARLSSLKLAFALLKQPRRIPGLIRLGRHSAQAADRLAKVLAQVCEI